MVVAAAEICSVLCEKTYKFIGEASGSIGRNDSACQIPLSKPARIDGSRLRSGRRSKQVIIEASYLPCCGKTGGGDWPTAAQIADRAGYSRAIDLRALSGISASCASRGGLQPGAGRRHSAGAACRR